MEQPYYEWLREFWTPFVAYLSLLGVLLIILGIGLAGLASLGKSKERKSADSN
jgi:uncharacterized membrane protein